MRELFYGETRFDGFVHTLGIARSTLTTRLNHLLEAGLVTRQEYQRDPVRCEYLLTEKGQDFFGVIAAINAWGDRWMSDDSGVPVVIRHETCGHDLQAVVVCQYCGDEVRYGDFSVHLGSGYPAHLRGNPDIAARLDRASASESARPEFGKQSV